MLTSANSKWGLNRKAWAALLRVRTGPECPGNNLRELMWQQPKLWDSQRGKKKRERENFPMKSSNLRCSLAHSQNKGLSQCQRKAIRLWSGPSPSQRQRGRWATARAGRQGAISTPEMASSAKLWAGSQLLTKSSWDPGWLTLSRRGAAWDQLTEEIHSTPEMALLWHTWETEWLGPGKCMRCTAHMELCHHGALRSLSGLDLGSGCSLGLWQPPCGPSTMSALPHACDVCLQCSSLSTAQLNKWAWISGHFTPSCQGRNLTLKRCKQKRPVYAKKEGGTTLNVSGATD